MATDPNANPDVAPAAPAPVATTAPPAVAQAGVRPGNGATVSFWQSFVLGMTKPGELPVYHHSNLFYWWPIWLFGFLFAGITYFGDNHIALVPAGAQVKRDQWVGSEQDKDKLEKRHVIVLPDKAEPVKVKNKQGDLEDMQPTIYMARQKWLGTVFVIVLLIVIFITNITLRGLWSVFVLVVLVALSLIFWVADWWEIIFARLGQLAIYINLGGYFTLATVLFIFWCVNFFIFDRQTYMIFTPGQVRVRLEIGGGEIVYDTLGMVVHKERSDLFRHWVLGFGSGDLVIRPANLGHALHLPNVLRIGRKVRQIEEMVREKVVVTDVTPGPPAST